MINKASMVIIKAVLKLVEVGILLKEINLGVGGMSKEETRTRMSNLVKESTKTVRTLVEIDNQVQEEINSKEAEETSSKTVEIIKMILSKNMTLRFKKDNKMDSKKITKTSLDILDSKEVQINNSLYSK